MALDMCFYIDTSEQVPLKVYALQNAKWSKKRNVAKNRD